ncbi:MAG TPA: hydrogenase maturation nickel metallochaperone HypA [Candidatus Aquicultor sp.]
MHELGLTQGIIDIAIDNAQQNNATKILKISVKAGKLMALVEDSMQFYFDYLTNDTIAKGATLVIEHVPVIIKCHACGETSEVDEFGIHICPKCGEITVELVSGKEFYVDSIEVE